MVMGVGYNPRIVTDGLVLCLDAANPRSAPTTAIESAVVSSVTGSGPSYNVVYTTNVSAARVGDKVNVEKREAGAGTSSTVLSTYTYEITGLDRSLNQLTLTYESDTASLGDDSPADLPSGGGSSGSPEIAPHDIVSLWIDMKGGNNGTPTNGPTFSSDNGGGIEFDATNEYIETNIISLGNTFSVSFWMYVRQLYNYGDPLGATTNSNTDYGMTFVTYSDGHMVFNVGGGSPWSTSCSTSTGFLSNGNWYFVTGVKSSSNQYLYIDGEFIDSVSNTRSLNNHKIVVGARWPSQYPFRGSVSTVLIHNKTLTAKEILQNYEAAKGRYA